LVCDGYECLGAIACNGFQFCLRAAGYDQFRLARVVPLKKSRPMGAIF